MTVTLNRTALDQLSLRRRLSGLPRLLAVAACVSLVAGCATSKVSAVPVKTKIVHEVRAIALTPGGGLLADAVGVELANRGYTVVDPAQFTNLMVRLNLNELEVAQPAGLQKLKDAGLDAYLSVKAAAGYDDQPQSASARLVSTHTGQLLAGVSWQNGWGGVKGSMADRTMRKGLAKAAEQITDSLVKSLPK